MLAIILNLIFHLIVFYGVFELSHIFFPTNIAWALIGLFAILLACLTANLDKIVLFFRKARRYKGQVSDSLHLLTSNISYKQKTTTPNIYLEYNGQSNAYIVGTLFGRKSIVLDYSLLDRLNENEIKVVVSYLIVSSRFLPTYSLTLMFLTLILFRKLFSYIPRLFPLKNKVLINTQDFFKYLFLGPLEYFFEWIAGSFKNVLKIDDIVSQVCHSKNTVYATMTKVANLEYKNGAKEACFGPLSFMSFYNQNFIFGTNYKFDNRLNALKDESW